jgi:cysteine synthase A
MSGTAPRNVVESVEGLIGDTPLLRLEEFTENPLGKLEAANAYSVKDRIAREMIDAAEDAGALSPGGTVVEATSGNTGIGLATVAAARGYDCVLTMPESMFEERRTTLAAIGADLELTPAEEGMGGANRRAEELATGAALAAATEYATEHPTETTVVVLPDTGERYLSTELFDGG